MEKNQFYAKKHKKTYLDKTVKSIEASLSNSALTLYAKVFNVN